VRRPPRLVVAALVMALVIVGALVKLMSESSFRRTATNDALLTIGAHVPPHRSICQPRQIVPAGTGIVLLFARSFGKVAGPLRITVRDESGRVVTSGVTRRRVFGTPVTGAPLRTVRQTVRPARVCIRNMGAEPVDVMAAQTGSPSAELPPAPALPYAFVKVRLDFLTAQPKSWWSFAPTVADRFGNVKATFFGAWTAWVTLALLLVLCLGTVLYAARELGR
jgi:hypothetical protein